MKIVNIICSGSFNQKVKLQSLLSLDPTILEYDPEMHHAAYLIVNGKRIIFYPNGKYIFTGLKNIDEISFQFDAMKLILKSFLNVDLFIFPIVQNIVITTKVPRFIDLVSLMQKSEQNNFQYNPKKLVVYTKCCKK